MPETEYGDKSNVNARSNDEVRIDRVTTFLLTPVEPSVDELARAPQTYSHLSLCFPLRETRNTTLESLNSRDIDALFQAAQCIDVATGRLSLAFDYDISQRLNSPQVVEHYRSLPWLNPIFVTSRFPLAVEMFGAADATPGSYYHEKYEDSLAGVSYLVAVNDALFEQAFSHVKPRMSLTEVYFASKQLIADKCDGNVKAFISESAEEIAQLLQKSGYAGATVTMVTALQKQQESSENMSDLGRALLNSVALYLLQPEPQGVAIPTAIRTAVAV